MDSLSPQVVSAAKLPILNPNKFDLWKIRIEQYFLMTDYSLWEVILNGNSPVLTRIVKGVVQPVAPTTAEQKLARKNELKAREVRHSSSLGTESHNLAFVSSTPTNSTNDSVSAAVIVSTVGTKLSALTLPNVDSLSNAALYGLHQAPRAWYETLATYLLENGFQRGTIDQTLFIKKQQKDILLVQIYVDDIIFGVTNKALCESFEKMMKDKFQMSSMGELTFFLGLQVKKKKDGIFINQDKYVGEILKKFGLSEGKSAGTPIDVEKPLLKDSDGEDVDVHTYRSMIGSLMYLTSSRPDIMFAVCACAQFQVTTKVSHVNAVKRIFRYLKGKPYLGLWYPKDSPFNLVAYSDSDYAGASLDRKSTTGGCQFLGCRLISWQCKKQTVVATSSTEAKYVAAASGCAQVLPSAPIIEDWVSDSEEDTLPQVSKDVPSFAQTSKLVKSPRNFRQLFQAPILVAPTVPLRSNPHFKGSRKTKKACFVCKSVDHLIKECDFDARKLAHRTYASRDIHKQYALVNHCKFPLHKVPAAAPLKSQSVLTTAARTVSALKPIFSMTRPKLASHAVSKSKSPLRRHLPRHPSSNPKTSPPRVTVAKASVVSAAQDNQGTWVWRPKCLVLDHDLRTTSASMTLKRFDYNDALGRSKHMTGNMSYLSDYKELNGGYVAFGGNPKGGKITKKGKIKTGKLDFDDVYFVKELKFNLFSVSQMYDKKNIILFTDTECLVLSFDFKLLDASPVLLRVLRENNMYIEATLDESNLWHRRLGHVNFKTYNKLVKGNLVRGLPTKVFTYDNSCVACKKGKQHRASCKSKTVSSVDQPLFRLHMDLFGPTFVKSLNKKSYCLVITDDYSRFSWVFFLASKDETPPGIKREFSVPRTPQQNGIARRKNRTLIEAARTLLADLLLPISFWAKAVNEGFLIGYSVCSKAFRVFNSRTHIVHETLHVNFMENKPKVAGSGPAWLFDIDSLTRTMNYHPVIAENQTNSNAEGRYRYSVCSKAFRVFNSRTRIVQETLHVNFMENKPNVAGSGPAWLFDIDSLTRTMNYHPVIAKNQTNSNTGFQDTKKAGEEGTQTYVLFPVAAGPSNAAMPNWEDLTHSNDADDVDAEADINNLESIILVSPIPTTKIHKDHPTS
nr:putative ribonuclease H-like domain-containing protein [Tanacetum cinerariifolium]